ncbi:hypothetical protein Tco_1182836 [Tanacetum coccineum]
MYSLLKKSYVPRRNVQNMAIKISECLDKDVSAKVETIVNANLASMVQNAIATTAHAQIQQFMNMDIFAEVQGNPNLREEDPELYKLLKKRIEKDFASSNICRQTDTSKHSYDDHPYDHPKGECEAKQSNGRSRVCKCTANKQILELCTRKRLLNA